MEKVTVEIKHDGVLKEKWEMDSNTWKKIHGVIEPILNDLQEYMKKKKKEKSPN